ncbi:pentapeptide repeat-containing protein [Propioniciclava coleopterorum]|uniref:Pentapeptide repeat-containing protein n=1 Tax=Propioniciclava coleopterorum TaxID=2714937 RepID=A0A6G7Y9S0_9ACTN|nr:pentapeptide repeat-containing protein [Propioniciclava coleopterorum]QIK73520.1 pentapeptide repeat-containing protein [Propioniciclava coleopterorum]
MTTAPDALLAALVPRGWSLTPAVADRTADLARLSALAIPADWAACLLRFDALVGPDEDAWFLALDDYTGTSDAAFAWDEWRTLSLDAAMGPDDAARVTRFWDDVLPILLAVGARTRSGASAAPPASWSAAPSPTSRTPTWSPRTWPRCSPRWRRAPWRCRDDGPRGAGRPLAAPLDAGAARRPQGPGGGAGPRRARPAPPGDGLVGRGRVPRPARAGAGREPVRLSFLTLSRVDLSHARGAVSLYRCVIEDGRFDHAALATGTRLGRRLERCSFRAARLRGVTLGTEVVGCDFTGADARRLICEPNTRFEDCTFEGVDLSDAALADATFVRCSFAGAVLGPGTSFSRCTFVDTDLDPGPARLTRCRRDGADLPDRWDGAADAEADLQRFAARYAARLAAGETDLPLGDD